MDEKIMDEKSLELENEKLKRAKGMDKERVFYEITNKYLRKFFNWEKGAVTNISNKYYSDAEIKRILESEFIVNYCKTALRVCWDFPEMYSALFTYLDSEKVKENARRVVNEMRDYILEKNIDDVVNTKAVAGWYDKKVVCYFDAAKSMGIDVDDRIYASIKKFYDNLPEDMHFFDTEFYKKYWINNKDNKNIYNIHTVSSKEEYEAKLAEFRIDRNGIVDEPIKYDHLLGEYLWHYGDELSYEEKEHYLYIMSKNAYRDDFFSTQTARYFKDTVSGNELLENNPLIVYNDILRKYKQSYYSVTCLNCPIYRKLYSEMKANYMEVIGNLGKYGDSAIEFAKNLRSAEHAHYFNRRYNVSPDFENVDDVVDIVNFVNRVNVSNALAKNFDDDKLNDTTVYENGLTNFDYADIALSLIARNYVFGGIEEVNDEETKELYARYGRDVNDSKAMREIIRAYTDRERRYNYERIKEIKNPCVDFVICASRKPGFNLFSDRECSDIVQIAKCSDNDFARYLETEITRGMMENPEYTNISLDEAYDYAWRFMDYVGDRPMGKELEYEFEDFLRALSVIKINDERGLVPQEFNEFIIRQSLTENSILNSGEERYENAFERAVENLHLNRVIKGENQDDKNVLLYFVRDLKEYKNFCGIDSDVSIIDKKRLIHNLLADPMFSKSNEKANVPQYVEQYVDLDAIEASILGKMEAEKAEQLMAERIEEREF